MKEKNDPVQVKEYVQQYGIEQVFNDDIMPFLSLYFFEQGEIICSQGEPTDYFYVLVKGKLKIFTTSEEGKTLILNFITPLEAIGDIEYVQQIDTINTVEAVSPVVMIGVRQAVLRKVLSDHAPFLQFLLGIITKKFYAKSNSMRINLMYPVEVRLASYLLSVVYDENGTVVNKKLTANLTDTANLIGTSYRHLNRVIQEFCREGIVERSKGAILIKDLQGLKRIAKESLYS